MITAHRTSTSPPLCIISVMAMTVFLLIQASEWSFILDFFSPNFRPLPILHQSVEKALFTQLQYVADLPTARDILAAQKDVVSHHALCAQCPPPLIHLSHISWVSIICKSSQCVEDTKMKKETGRVSQKTRTLSSERGN